MDCFSGNKVYRDLDGGYSVKRRLTFLEGVSGVSSLVVGFPAWKNPQDRGVYTLLFLRNKTNLINVKRKRGWVGEGLLFCKY